MTGKKSMEVLRVKANKLNEKLVKLQVKADRAKAMAQKWENQLHKIENQKEPMAQRIAGLNGHLAMEEFGATQYETYKTEDGWGAIKFFNEAGIEVRNPRWDKVD